METVYSGMFLAEPNKLESWGADGEHNLQVFTRENLYTAGGPECWHDKFLRHYIKWVSSLQDQTQIHG